MANRKGIKTREESFSWRSVSHPHISTYTLTHRHLQTHKGRHYLEAMDHVNGILSTLRECGRCFSAWLRRLSSGTVCTTNSIYFIFRDEDGRLERLNISVCLYVCVWAVGYAAVWEIKRKGSMDSSSYTKLQCSRKKLKITFMNLAKSFYPQSRWFHIAFI